MSLCRYYNSYSLLLYNISAYDIKPHLIKIFNLGLYIRTIDVVL